MAELADWQTLLAIACGYFLGAIPFGLILTRFAGEGDIRAIGSGNIGATNVLRTGNRWLAAGTLVGDLLKGTAAVLVGLTVNPLAAVLAGVAAFVGHLFPIWLSFRGGKGVATYIGVALGLDWRVAALFAVIWIAVAAITRISSASALIASLAAPIAFMAFGKTDMAIATAAMTALLWFRHSENIGRLIAGTESRIGQKS